MNRISKVLTFGALVLTVSVQAQTPQAQPAQVAAAAAPATKLEAIQPASGSLLTMGYDRLGGIGGFKGSYDVSVDAREMATDKGAKARGIVVEIRESQYREATSFIDADELPELIRAIEGLLAIKENPTTFPNFQVSYRTRGEFEVTAYSLPGGPMQFALRAGRGVIASKNPVKAADMTALLNIIKSSQERLKSK